MWATDHPHLTLDDPKQSILERVILEKLIDAVFQSLAGPAKIRLPSKVEYNIEFLFFPDLFFRVP